MDHGELNESLGAYLIGGLDVDETREIRRHLEDCPSCRRDLSELEGLGELLEAATLTIEPPPGLEDRVLARVRDEAVPVEEAPVPIDAVRERRLFPTSALVTAAVVSFVIAVGVTVFIQRPAPPRVGATASPSATTNLPRLQLLANTEPVSQNRGARPPTSPRTAMPGGELTIGFGEGSWECELRVWGLEKGQLYEVWFKNHKGHWLSGGSFRVNSRSERSLRLTTGAASLEFNEVMITAEDDDGDPLPSGIVVLRGSLPS